MGTIKYTIELPRDLDEVYAWVKSDVKNYCCALDEIQTIERKEKDDLLVFRADIQNKVFEYDAKLAKPEPNKLGWISIDGSSNGGELTFRESGTTKTNIDVAIKYDGPDTELDPIVLEKFPPDAKFPPFTTKVRR